MATSCRQTESQEGTQGLDYETKGWATWCDLQGMENRNTNSRVKRLLLILPELPMVCQPSTCCCLQTSCAHTADNSEEGQTDTYQGEVPRYACRSSSKSHPTGTPTHSRALQPQEIEGPDASTHTKCSWGDLQPSQWDGGSMAWIFQTDGRRSAHGQGPTTRNLENQPSITATTWFQDWCEGDSQPFGLGRGLPTNQSQ